MAATSDDDVADLATATGHDANPDGDTTAAAVAPATAVPSTVPSDSDEEDRTMQQLVDQKVRHAVQNAIERGGVPPAPPRPAPPAPPVRMTSKKMTAVGLGVPQLPSTRPAANVPVAAPVEATEADADDSTVTAAAPAPQISERSPVMSLTMPGAVTISEMPDDDEIEETEVRTLVAGLPSELPVSTSPVPAAGSPATEPEPDPADELDDSVTTQAPSAVLGGRLPEEDEPKTSPPIQIAQLSPPIPAAGRRPSSPEPITVQHTLPHPDDAYDAEESVTTRGPAVDYEDDSVTAQAPVTRASERGPAALGLPPALDDGTDGTTKRVAKRPVPKTLASPVAKVDGSPADDEAESITTQAPGHLTNMLRVIASGTPGEGVDEVDEDELAENKTAVMLGAPVKPMPSGPSGSSRVGRTLMAGGSPSGGARAAAIADLREPSSDSGLRVARAEAPSGDHASLGAILPHHVDAGFERSSGIERNSPAAFANTEQAFGARPPQPSLREFDFGATVKKPRYGLLVGLVALLSFAIPLVLFLWLHQTNEVAVRAPSEPAPDLVSRGDVARAKATKGAPPPVPVQPTSHTTPQNNPPRQNWFPRRK